MVLSPSLSTRDNRETRIDTGSETTVFTTPHTGQSPLHSRLLRHWTEVAALTISRNDSDRGIWQTIVPRRALTNPYLLHGVYAISAIHLAFDAQTQNDEREGLIKTAEHHQSGAIQLFTRHTEEQHQFPHMENFVLSSLLIGFAFAFPLSIPASARESPEPLEEMIQIIGLIKSTMTFSAPILTGVKSDEMAQLTHVNENHSGGPQCPCPPISVLYEINANHVKGPESRQAFQTTIEQLEDLFSKINRGAEPLSHAYIWICEISNTFYCSLQQRHPLALIIFAYYCVALHHLRHLWWISSWGQRVLNDIHKMLRPVWMPFIECVHPLLRASEALESVQFEL